MSDAKAQQEPTMEEILASIRRIISEDGSPGEGQAADQNGQPADKPPVLELTQELKEDGSVVEIAPQPSPQPQPEPILSAMNEQSQTPSQPVEIDDEGLVSQTVASAAAAQLGSLAGAVNASRSVPLGAADRTLEDIVRELLRPMLKQWLDVNLQPIVQRIVEREVAKLANRADVDRFR